MQLTTTAKLTALFLALFLTACVTEDTGVEEANFYDLKGYFEEEGERLNGQPMRINKTITLNGTTETQELDNLDFKTDLQLFAAADINKNAWVDKYETELEELSGSHKVTRYTALDTTLTTQLLEVEEDRGQTIRVKILRKTGTVLSSGKSEMIYQPSTGYTVATQQENRFGEDVDALVKVTW